MLLGLPALFAAVYSNFCFLTGMFWITEKKLGGKAFH